MTDDPRHIRHLTAGDLAERESLPVSTVYGWNYSGEGPPYFRVGRHVRYRLEDVERWELERIVERSDRYKAIERTGRRRYESQVRQYEQRLREYEWQVRELEQRAYAARPRPPAAPEQLVPPQPLAPPIEEQRALLDRILKGVEMRTAQLKVNGIYARWEYGLGVPERLVLLELQGRGWILVRREDGEQERIRTDKLAGPFETVWHEYEEREAHARRLQLPSEDLIEVHGGLGEALGHRVDVDLERQRAAVLVAELRGDVGCGYPGCGQEAGGRVAEGVDNPIRLPLTQLVMGADRGRRATRRWPPGSSPQS